MSICSLPSAISTPWSAHLRRHGWRSTKLSPYDQHYYRAWTHELPPMVHVEREVELDLHHNILPRMARLKPRAELLLQGSEPIAGQHFRKLADVDLVLHAMTHLMFDSALADALRDLVDIDDLLRHFADADRRFWERLLERAVALDLTRPAFYALRYTQRLLGTPVPGRRLARSRRGAPSAPIVVAHGSARAASAVSTASGPAERGRRLRSVAVVRAVALDSDAASAARAPSALQGLRSLCTPSAGARDRRSTAIASGAPVAAFRC